jgi:fatty-acyl-CoA synthase
VNAKPSRHVRGELSPSLLEDTIGALLHRAARQWPATAALISLEQRIRWNYEELIRRVDECAAALLSLGLKRGDRVAIWAPNCAEWVLTQFATARVGLIQANINPAYRLAELEYT